ncbi:RNA polymerase sigma factor [Promicromonospora vindobonensis]|uniref:RNA polymerase sigma factor n=1 Tax=Promicromonospora vindobonensis TaxID=195748 RepID=A0ABW5W1J7_9MICO
MAQWERELEELMARRSRALAGYAYSLTRNTAQAEDLVQDALVKVFSRLRRPRGTADGGQVVDLDHDLPRLTNAEAYVRRAILTIYLDGYRRQNSWTGIKHLLADEDRAPAAERVATAKVDVGVALAKLSPRQRESVVLRFFEDMTVPQIAQTLGTSPGTIKRHLANAMELLRGSLAEMTAPELDTALDERVGAVVGAVRRRRAVKVGALGGASLVLAGVLAVAALWGPARFLSEPVPPATPSPETSAQTAGAGFTPEYWREVGTRYQCGMEVEDLTSTSDVVRLELTGDVTAREHGVAVPVRVTRDSTEGLDASGAHPRLVFARDGQVVDLGMGWTEAGYPLPDAGESTVDTAEAGAADACGDWTLSGSFETYVESRPAGTYDVYAVLPWFDHAPDGSNKQYLAVSEPVTLEVPELALPDEKPLSVDIRDGYQPEWLKGTSLACGAYVSDIPAGPRLPSQRSGVSAAAGVSRFIDAGSHIPEDEVWIYFNQVEEHAADTIHTPFTLVWVSDTGRVVGVGRDVSSEPAEKLPTGAEDGPHVVVPVEPDTTCLTHPEDGLPAGEYALYAFTRLDPGSAGEPQYLAVEAGPRVIGE